jgi:hypothetical protein
MNKYNIKFLSILSILFFLSGCGFSKVSTLTAANFSIRSIEIEGEKKIGSLIKNELVLYTEKNSENLLDLKLMISKNKSIKEKDIKNKITKYELTISASMTTKNIKSNKEKSSNFSTSSFYEVDKKYSKTLKNEKDLIKNLSERISKEIFRELSLNYF